MDIKSDELTNNVSMGLGSQSGNTNEPPVYDTIITTDSPCYHFRFYYPGMALDLEENRNKFTGFHQIQQCASQNFNSDR